MADGTKKLVLVTGGSGFLGSHCIIKALSSNYRVRTTVRSLKREKEVREMLTAGGVTNLDDVSFVETDLSKDDGWTTAVQGCTYVLHVASPFPPASPKHEDELIVPAREGTLRVLRAARDAGAKRVVITGSLAAISYGHSNWDYANKPFTESDWTDVDGQGVGAYAKSKTLAERAAWDFMEKEGGSLELAVINPGLILGPVLGPDSAVSIELISRLMNGSLPAAPRLTFTVVDVRDAAELHLMAMTDPNAKGQRFISCSPPIMTIQEISLALRDKMGSAARRAPRRQLPDILLKIGALFDPAIGLVVQDLGKPMSASADKAKSMLGWKPRSNVDAIVATAESLIKFGLVKT
jgi:nucleoside-diphosphate-sugar epimerase